jgi:hypothetical protein
VARGYYGDSLATRLYAEEVLQRRLWLLGDDGGAVDLAFLMGREGRVDSGRNMHLAQRCLNAKMLNLLARTDMTPTFGKGEIPRYEEKVAWHNLLRARGLIELGEYDEARELFERYAPELSQLPDFVPQCTKWLEGRAEEGTPVPVERPCNCDIEPPKWREGCGCMPEIDEPVEPVVPAHEIGHLLGASVTQSEKERPSDALRALPMPDGSEVKPYMKQDEEGHDPSPVATQLMSPTAHSVAQYLGLTGPAIAFRPNQVAYLRAVAPFAAAFAGGNEP